MVLASSGIPQLLLTVVAPSVAAVLLATKMALLSVSADSMTRILQLGQTALTMSTSSAVSTAQSVSAAGRLLDPSWATLRKQPFAIVHAGRLYFERYAARSDSRLG